MWIFFLIFAYENSFEAFFSVFAPIKHPIFACKFHRRRQTSFFPSHRLSCKCSLFFIFLFAIFREKTSKNLLLFYFPEKENFASELFKRLKRKLIRANAVPRMRKTVSCHFDGGKAFHVLQCFSHSIGGGKVVINGLSF